jgi:GNAT superfamily N-acetyltransferase
MDRDAVLAAFNEQVRRHQDPEAPGETVERDAHVVRSFTSGSGWAGIAWSDLDESSVDAVIAEQLVRFKGRGAFEWKQYSYDLPTDLPARLVGAGFVPGPPESLMVAEIADLELVAPPPSGVRLEQVTGGEGVQRFVELGEAVFGGNHAPQGAALRRGMSTDPPQSSAVVAMSGDTAVAAARLEFYLDTDFAGLWGGATLPAWRSRGIYRALVAHRATEARDRGFRYLQVDASPESRPILDRLGFAQLAVTTPFTYPGA